MAAITKVTRKRSGRLSFAGDIRLSSISQRNEFCTKSGHVHPQRQFRHVCLVTPSAAAIFPSERPSCLWIAAICSVFISVLLKITPIDDRPCESLPMYVVYLLISYATTAELSILDSFAEASVIHFTVVFVAATTSSLFRIE